MVTEVRPVELRYYLGQAHYHSDVEYSREALAESAAAYRRVEGFVTTDAPAGGVGGRRPPDWGLRAQGRAGGRRARTGRLGGRARRRGAARRLHGGSR